MALFRHNYIILDCIIFDISLSPLAFSFRNTDCHIYFIGQLCRDLALKSSLNVSYLLYVLRKILLLDKKRIANCQEEPWILEDQEAGLHGLGKEGVLSTGTIKELGFRQEDNDQPHLTLKFDSGLGGTSDFCCLILGCIGGRKRHQ